jgi:uncharacterized protein YxjI
MAYNQGVGGGYPPNTNNPGLHPTSTPGTNTAGTHSTGVGGGNYVQPPQNIGQATGLTPGAGTGAGISQQHVPVVGQQYVAQTVRSYAVSKKKMSVSKGDWTITDQVGHNHYKVDGRVASMKDKRFLRDASGNKILTMKKKLITMHDTWEILAGDGNHVLATAKKSSLVQFKTAMDVMLTSSTTGKHNPDYQVKGDFFDRNITVFRGAEQAALVTRQITFTTAILDKDTFGVTIFPGVDEAIVFALIIIMDEVFLHDNSDSD